MSLKTSISGIFAKDTPVMIMESGIAAFLSIVQNLPQVLVRRSENAKINNAARHATIPWIDHLFQLEYDLSFLSCLHGTFFLKKIKFIGVKRILYTSVIQCYIKIAPLPYNSSMIGIPINPRFEKISITALDYFFHSFLHLEYEQMPD